MPSYEALGKPDVEASLRVMFDMPAYFDFWPTIDRKYRDFGFSDRLADEERMAEYASVYKQLKKYVGTKLRKVLEMQGDLMGLEAWLGSQLRDSDVYPIDRVSMVYTSLKVDWLRQAANQVAGIREEIGDVR